MSQVAQETASTSFTGCSLFHDLAGRVFASLIVFALSGITGLESLLIGDISSISKKWPVGRCDHRSLQPSTLAHTHAPTTLTATTTPTQNTRAHPCTDDTYGTHHNCHATDLIITPHTHPPTHPHIQRRYPATATGGATLRGRRGSVVHSRHCCHRVLKLKLTLKLTLTLTTLSTTSCTNSCTTSCTTLLLHGITLDKT